MAERSEGSSGLILGLDIGGTKTTVLIGSDRAEIFYRRRFKTHPERGFEITFRNICRSVEEVLREARRLGKMPESISVSIGGPLDVKEGIIFSPPNLPGWDKIPLKGLLQQRFGLPVYLEHDGNAGALAEYFFGAGQGFRNIIFMTLGTGLGAGLILNGRLYRGTTDTAGEIGHIRIAETGPVAYGKEGSLEGYCSGSGLAKLAQDLFPARWSRGDVTAEEVGRLAGQGDADALKVVQVAAKYLGRGLAILVDILNPEVIIVGSLALRLGRLLLGPAIREMHNESLSRAASVCKVTVPALGERLGDVAALCAAIYEK